MPDSYNPLNAKVLSSVTIGGESYIVTSYTDNGAGATKVIYTNSDGSFRGKRVVKGEHLGSMGIECEDSAQPAPAQFTTFSYGSGAWLIETVAESQSSTAAAAWNLGLGGITGSA